MEVDDKGRCFFSVLSPVSLPSLLEFAAIYTVSDSGRVVRVWNKRNGALLWQKSLGDSVKTRFFVWLLG